MNLYLVYLLEEARLVRAFPMVPKLDLGLVGGKHDGILLRHGMRGIQNGLFGLLVQQIQLDGVARVDVGIAVKVLAFEHEDIAFHNALLAERLAMVNPVD